MQYSIFPPNSLLTPTLINDIIIGAWTCLAHFVICSEPIPWLLVDLIHQLDHLACHSMHNKLWNELNGFSPHFWMGSQFKPSWPWTGCPRHIHLGSIQGTIQGAALSTQPNFGHVCGSQILLKNWRETNFSSTTSEALRPLIGRLLQSLYRGWSMRWVLIG